MLPAPLGERLRRQPPGYQYSIGRVLLVYAGLMVAVFIATLDQTIVATALPRIVSDLGQVGAYSWVFTAFLLCQTISVPIYGKLGDMYGRKPMILAAITIFMVGSALCGAAGSLVELSIFRGVQGVGAGGLIPLAMATLGEIVPPRDRGRYQGLLSSVFATSSILGPAAGGLIVDHASWRWIFYVNLPIGGVALVAIVITLPSVTKRIEHSIDVVGAFLLAACTGTFLLALMWGSDRYSWESVQVVGLFAASVAALMAFIRCERRVKEPILPLNLFHERIVVTSAVGMGLSAMCMFGTIAFVPLFAQGVIGVSATASGVVLTPFILGAVVGTVTSGLWVSRTGRYRVNALLGPIVFGLGMTGLWRMGVATTRFQAGRNMAVSGVGFGLMMQTFMVAAQNIVGARILGTATAVLQFSRAIGTTIGVALFGAIVNHGLPANLRDRAAIDHRLDPVTRNKLADALHPAFLLAMCSCAVVLATVYWGLEERPLSRSLPAHPPGDGDEQAASSIESSI